VPPHHRRRDGCIMGPAKIARSFDFALSGRGDRRARSSSARAGTRIDRQDSAQEQLA
jgi:hypothetical protein